MTQKKIVTAFDLEFDDAKLQKFYGQTMMSIKDLMFGDWVDAEGYGRVKGIIIDEEDYCPQVLIRDDVWYPLNLIEPIPLTPEILEKNGFKECGKDDTDGAILYELGDDFLGVSLWVNIEPCLLGIWRTWAGESLYSVIKELPISFVHQLQHALRLCGIDKEIIL